MEQKMARLSLGTLVSAVLFVLALICLSATATLSLGGAKQQTHAAVAVPEADYFVTLTKTGSIYNGVVTDSNSNPMPGVTNASLGVVFNYFELLGGVVHVTFDGGGSPLDIGTTTITVTTGTTYIFDGELTGSRGSGNSTILNQGTLYVVGGLMECSAAGRPITNSGGDLYITGGTIQSALGVAIYNIGDGTINISEADSDNPTLITSTHSNISFGTIHLESSSTVSNETVLLTMTGGIVENTNPESGRAIFNNSTGIADISGGTVRMGLGSAIVVAGTGAGLRISQADPEVPTIITSNYSSANYATVYLGLNTNIDSQIYISGGTITNTSPESGVAIRNASSSSVVNISGGNMTSNGTIGTIHNNTTGVFNISGGIITNTSEGAATTNAAAGVVNISGGDITSYGWMGTVCNNTTGLLNITGGTITNAGTGTAVLNGETGNVNISNATVSSSTIVAGRGTIAQSGAGVATFTITDSLIANGSGNAIYANNANVVLDGGSYITANIVVGIGKLAVGSSFFGINPYSVALINSAAVVNGSLLITNGGNSAGNFNFTNLDTTNFGLGKSGDHLYALVKINFTSAKGTAPSAILATVGGKYPTLPNFSVTGYDFGGWFYGGNEVATGESLPSVTLATTLVADLTLLAPTLSGIGDINRAFAHGVSGAVDITVKVVHDLFPAGVAVTYTVYKWVDSSFEIFSAGLAGITTANDNGTYKITTDSFTHSGETIVSLSQTFDVTIYAVDISSTATIDSISSQPYTGSDIEPILVVKNAGTTLTINTDYTVTYSANKNAGTAATATVTFKGNYAGTKSVTFTITALNITGETNIADIAAQPYTGNPIQPALVIVYNGKTLANGTDYTVAYSYNTNVGTAATATVTFKGNYAGTASKSFTISALNVSGTATIDSISSQPYTGSDIEPILVVKNAGTTLTINTDYTVTYSANKNAGTAATATVTFKGNYAGTKSVTFTITALSISETATIEAIANQNYTGAAIEPSLVVKNAGVTLTAGTDYDVTYSANINAGTAATATVTFKSNYAGVKTATFTIAVLSVVDGGGEDAGVVVVSDIAKQVLKNGVAEPTLTIKLGDIVLTQGVDYTVTFSDNTATGTATVEINFQGNYSGTLVRSFEIVEASTSYVWLIVLAILVALLGAGLGVYFYQRNRAAKQNKTVKSNFL